MKKTNHVSVSTQEDLSLCFTLIAWFLVLTISVTLFAFGVPSHFCTTMQLRVFPACNKTTCCCGVRKLQALGPTFECEKTVLSNIANQYVTVVYGSCKPWVSGRRGARVGGWHIESGLNKTLKVYTKPQQQHKTLTQTIQDPKRKLHK